MAVAPSLAACAGTSPSGDATTEPGPADVADAVADLDDGDVTEIDPGDLQEDALPAIPGVEIERTGSLLVARTSKCEVDLDEADGSFALRGAETGGEVRRLHLAVEVPEGDGRKVHTTLGRPMTCGVAAADGAARIDCATSTDNGFDVGLTVTLGPGRPGVLGLSSTFANKSGGPVTVRKVYPFRSAASDGGAVFLGADPRSVRILQNGTDELLDFYVAMLTGDTPLTDPDSLAIATGASSFSNGSALAADLDGGASLLAGFTDFEWAIPQVAMAGDTAKAKPEAGRVPMTELWGEARFPWDVAIPDGHAIDGGTAVLVVGAGTPHEALETYADEVRAAKGITLPGAPFSGWDSWYTGIETGLTEEYARANADGLAKWFGPFGLASMQLDWGWNDTWGDWNASPSFPSGIPAAAGYIGDRGLVPEVWVAPFSASEASQVYKDHPGWYRPRNLYGQIAMPSDIHPMDLANPEVAARYVEVAKRLSGWGFGSVKMDFAYHALMSELPPDPDATNVALYRKAVRAFRAALAPGTYFINISQCFPNYGLVDAMRTGLDTWPCWEGGGDCPGHPLAGMQAQGVKPAVVMAARRYWMNGRIWWNHNDQVFFRDLATEEARAWFSVAGLSGGMVSLGEDASKVTEEQADLYRRILPLTGVTARPLDLFRRDVPEVWVADPGDGSRVVGLFNWGANLDLTKNPFAPIPEAGPIELEVPLADLGLDPAVTHYAYEFWTGSAAEVGSGPDGKRALAATIPPRTGRVFRVTPAAKAGPTYLGTDRHILMGRGFVKDLLWHEEAGTLIAMVRTTPGFTQTMAFWTGDTEYQFAGPGEGSVWGGVQGDVSWFTFDGLDGQWHLVHLAAVE
jgi:hypothetical protein